MNASIRLTIGLAAVVLVSGCAADSKAKKTPKEEAALKWNQTRASVMYGLARDQFNGGELETAAKTADDALAMDPENVPLRLLDARIAIERNQLEIADQQLAEARKRQPINAEASYYAGIVAQRWQKFDLALQCYTDANVAQPTELAYLLARAEMLVRLDRSTEALTALRDKVSYFENSAELRDAVGQLLCQAGRFAEAADMFRQASILASTDDGIRERLAIACFQAGQPRDCSEVLTPLFLKPTFINRADLLIVMGECELQLDQPMGAKEFFQRALDLNPGLARGWLGLTKIALLSNDLPRADVAAKKALALDGLSADAHIAAGYVKLKQNLLADALIQFKTAAALRPKDALAVCMTGCVLERQGEHDAALECYGRALNLDPQDVLARRLLADASSR